MQTHVKSFIRFIIINDNYSYSLFFFGSFLLVYSLTNFKAQANSQMTMLRKYEKSNTYSLANFLTKWLDQR